MSHKLFSVITRFPFRFENANILCKKETIFIRHRFLNNFQNLIFSVILTNFRSLLELERNFKLLVLILTVNVSISAYKLLIWMSGGSYFDATYSIRIVWSFSVVLVSLGSEL